MYSPGYPPDVEEYDTTLLALVVKLVFETLSSNPCSLFDSVVETKDSYELWLFEDFLALGGNEIILYPVEEHLKQGLSEEGQEVLRTDSFDIVAPLNPRFLESVYTCLSKGQLQTELELFETTVKNEVCTGHFLLFPKPTDRSDKIIRANFKETSGYG
ncbi:hypothetical protein [Haloarchaeobius sp. DFWS5]|uniref:hypothetical protein n=1 Tax=Haloarchaeobius sp. DFWS5 TaxID=3446114 RepID=UPI003EB9AAA9